MQNEDSIIGTALSWVEQGDRIATATVIDTWGSSPRPVGSQMVISSLGRFEGSVSGGCIEAAVVVEAQEILRGEKPRRMIFGVSNARAWEVRLACGGELELVIENYTGQAQLLRRQAALETNHQAYCTVTNLANGDKTIIEAGEINRLDDFPEDVKQGVQEVFLSSQSKIIQAGGSEYFLHHVSPGLQLVIIGAVHVAKPLVKMAQMAGYPVVIIEPRSAFAESERLAGVQVIPEWPDKALEKMVLHPGTAIVALSHFSKLDDLALIAALQSEAFYVGALGSRKTHALRWQRLAAAGVSEENLRRIHGPVGLPIGAQTPMEIAVAIMAEIIQKRRKGPSLNKENP
jgi:xanthine dehydrogenase accessory factor